MHDDFAQVRWITATPGGDYSSRLSCRGVGDWLKHQSVTGPSQETRNPIVFPSRRPHRIGVWIPIQCEQAMGRRMDQKKKKKLLFRFSLLLMKQGFCLGCRSLVLRMSFQVAGYSGERDSCLQAYLSTMYCLKTCCHKKCGHSGV